MKEIPISKVITPYTVSDRLRVNGSLARQAIRDLAAKGLIRAVSVHSSQLIYTRSKEEEAKPAAATTAAPPKKGAKKGAAAAAVVAAEE